MQDIKVKKKKIVLRQKMITLIIKTIGGLHVPISSKDLVGVLFFGKKVLLINIKDTKTSIVCITLFMTA